MKRIGRLLAIGTVCAAVSMTRAYSEVIVCKAQKSNGICAYPPERNQNKGAAKTIKVKDREHYFIAGFDLSAAKYTIS